MTPIASAVILLTLSTPPSGSDTLAFAQEQPVVQAKNDKKKPAEKPRKPNFTISRDTTYVTAPIDKDGYIDYEAVLNEKLRQGVTPDNNAVVLLFKAFGPRPDGTEIPPEFFAWLKMPVPPAKGDYFVQLQQHVKERFKEYWSPEANKLYDRAEKAGARPWSAKEYPEIADWLKRNEKPLAIVIEASRRSHYYYPQVAKRTNGKRESLITAGMQGVQACRGLASALTCRAMQRVAEKRYDEAWQDLLACHRLGRLVGRGGTLIDGLVGVAITDIATEADLAFLDGAKRTAGQLKSALKDLQNLGPLPKLADQIGLTERFWFLEAVMRVDQDAGAIDDLVNGPNPNRARQMPQTSFPWDATLRRGNQYYTRMSQAMRLHDRTMRSKQLAMIEQEIASLRVTTTPRGMLEALVASDGPGDFIAKLIGDRLISLLIPALSRIQERSDRAEQVQHNLHIAFALAAYKSDQGRYPAKLDALAPKCLAVVPPDLFTGKPLIYRPTETGYLFYSVGVNGQDEQGRTYSDDPRGDDLAVRMPLPKQQQK